MRGKKLMIHNMNLHPEPYDMIKSGLKTIELRLNDEKRSLVKVGDTIFFQNTLTGNRIETIVSDLYKFKSFEELYKELPLDKCGYTDIEVPTAKASDMLPYYSIEKQFKYGVLGIEVRIVKEHTI
jgi:ASC-1-like (ASCH) protein